jgi:hypothetical protein
MSLLSGISHSDPYELVGYNGMSVASLVSLVTLSFGSPSSQYI